jgi:hypothetical protein
MKVQFWIKTPEAPQGTKVKLCSKVTAEVLKYKDGKALVQVESDNIDLNKYLEMQ